MAHPLIKYFEANPGLQRGEFCDKAKISRMTLSRLIRGKEDYSTALLRRVSIATGGAVTVLELIEHLEQRKAPAKRASPKRKLERAA